MKKRVVIGIGNKLMGDEGVGIHAIEYLRSLSPLPLPLFHQWRGNKVKVDLVDGGTGGIALLHIFEKYDEVILIDAADFGGKAGEVRSFVIASEAKQSSELNHVHEIASSPTAPRNDIVLTSDSPQLSLHATSIVGILELAKKLNVKLPKITIVAIQPEKITPSMELSDVCQNALSQTVDAIYHLLPC